MNAPRTRRHKRQQEATFDDDDRDYSKPPNYDEAPDITHGEAVALSAAQFRSEAFARANIQLVAEYAGYRAMGTNSERAFIRTFGTAYNDMRLGNRIEALEHNPIYRQVFIEQFSRISVGQMWDVKLAALELLNMVNNPFVKDATRLTAIKELNVLFGITVVDDTGRTRAGKGLKEFYADTVEADAKETTLTRHPEPGTPEAVAFLASRTEAQ